jgi:ketosteroid isomerase-like protein
MSQKNVEIARRVMAAVADRDVEALIRMADAEIEWRTAFIGVGGDYQGHDGLRRYIADLHDAWDVLRAELHSAVTAGDLVVAVGRVHSRGRASRVETETPMGWVCRFRDGKVLAMRSFANPEQALEAVGLSE